MPTITSIIRGYSPRHDNEAPIRIQSCYCCGDRLNRAGVCVDCEIQIDHCKAVASRITSAPDDCSPAPHIPISTTELQPPPAREKKYDASIPPTIHSNSRVMPLGGERVRVEDAIRGRQRQPTSVRASATAAPPPPAPVRDVNMTRGVGRMGAIAPSINHNNHSDRRTNNPSSAPYHRPPLPTYSADYGNYLQQSSRRGDEFDQRSFNSYPAHDDNFTNYQHSNVAYGTTTEHAKKRPYYQSSKEQQHYQQRQHHYQQQQKQPQRYSYEAYRSTQDMLRPDHVTSYSAVPPTRPTTQSYSTNRGTLQQDTNYSKKNSSSRDIKRTNYFMNNEDFDDDYIQQEIIHHRPMTTPSSSLIPVERNRTPTYTSDNRIIPNFPNEEYRRPNAAAAVVVASPRPRKKCKTFDERFHEILMFKQKFGHCNVPQKPKNKDHIYHSLGIWTRNMRHSYKVKTLGADKITRLESIGFNWKFNNGPKSFDTYFGEMMQFKRLYGHVDVPIKNKDFQSLGRWCNNIRCSYRIMQQEKVNGTIQPKPFKLNVQQIALLESEGFKWRTRGKPQHFNR